jgi:hypothetical protein
MFFALGRIDPLRLDADIIPCLPLCKRRVGVADSILDATYELLIAARRWS